MVALRCYDTSEDGSKGIHSWYNGLAAKYRAEIDATLEELLYENTLDEIATVKPLRGKCNGLTEILVDFELDEKEIHIRILGFEGPNRGEFTLLRGFEKEKDNSIYGVECPKALQRKNGVMRDGRRAPICRIPTRLSRTQST